MQLSTVILRLHHVARIPTDGRGTLALATSSSTIRCACLQSQLDFEEDGDKLFFKTTLQQQLAVEEDEAKLLTTTTLQQQLSLRQPPQSNSAMGLTNTSSTAHNTLDAWNTRPIRYADSLGYQYL